MKFYARVCRSGSGLVGHQLEEFLNQSSPFYFWINGDRIDSLMENDRQQSHVMDIMEDSFNRRPTLWMSSSRTASLTGSLSTLSSSHPLAHPTGARSSSTPSPASPGTSCLSPCSQT
ncbi:clusterin-like [Sus scrofa]|uniref:clusterin-like n=1 Tax=Sus scrofa TaxID=9823 RepID=UPI000A2B8B8E|nr:clusterin-like [Sus scrofa]